MGVFEEYRYDALGRRILLRARRTCTGKCQSIIQRFVWDGDRLLYETRYPDHLVQDLDLGGNYINYLEEDTLTYRFIDLDHSHGCGEECRDTTFSPYYGRVVYTHGGGIDQPLEATRVGSASTPCCTTATTPARPCGRTRTGSAPTTPART